MPGDDPIEDGYLRLRAMDAKGFKELKLPAFPPADHVFAYTTSGARYAEGYGISPTRITSVMNSVDVSGTLAALNQLDAQELLRAAIAVLT